MTTKFFVTDIQLGQYEGAPVDTFLLQVGYRACCTSNADGMPDTRAGNWNIEFPLDSSPGAVFQAAYDRAVSDTAGFNWPDVPEPGDVYSYVPIDFASLGITDTSANAVVSSESTEKSDPKNKELMAFLTALYWELQGDAETYTARMTNAGNVIYPPPKPLAYDFFHAEGI